MSWFQIQFDLDNLVFEESDLAALFDDQYPVTTDKVQHTPANAQGTEKQQKTLETFFNNNKA